LHEDVDDEAMLVYRPRRPVPPADDLQSDFVHVQLVTGRRQPRRRSRPNTGPNVRTHWLISSWVTTPFCQKLLYIPQAERKAQIQPERA
jgi:hypothetical protein